MASCHVGLRFAVAESRCPSVSVYAAARLKAGVTKYRPLISKLSNRRLLPIRGARLPPCYTLVTLCVAECVQTKPTDERPKLYFPPTPQICSRSPVMTASPSAVVTAPLGLKSAGLADWVIWPQAAATGPGSV